MLDCNVGPGSKYTSGFVVHGGLFKIHTFTAVDSIFILDLIIFNLFNCGVQSNNFSWVLFLPHISEHIKQQSDLSKKLGFLFSWVPQMAATLA